MDTHTRRIRAIQADENAGPLPSKQASMAATLALQQARALEAPQLPRRAVLQPIPQNITNTVRSASTLNPKFPHQQVEDEGAGQHDYSPGSDATIDDIELGNCDDAEMDRDMQQPTSSSSAAMDPASRAAMHIRNGDISHDGRPMNADVYVDTHSTNDSNELGDSDVDAEFDDARLLNDHSHTASFSDDEQDEQDVLKLRMAILQQPPAECNPHALFPIETIQSQLMLEKCAQVVADTPGVLDAEDEDMWDASMVLEYSEDIFRHLRVMELRLLPSKGYMSHQKELNWSLRGVLIDWLVKVHFRFNLLPETLFLCVNYIDRFLSMKEVSLSRLQLVGAVALFIAAKFEEINYLSVQEVSQMVENNYDVEEILKAERFMIDLLDFNLGFPGPMSFLRRVSKADDYELETRTLAKYLLELTIMDERFVAAPPSWSAAVAHYMSRHMLRHGSWTPRHVYFSTYTEEQLLQGVAAVREAIEDPQKHHNAIFEKYSERKFRKAAQFVCSWVQLVKEHPDMDFPCAKATR